MKLLTKSRQMVLVAGACALMAASFPAGAQDVSDSHLSAARAALSAMKATEEFDSILPRAAQALKSELIQQNPDLQADIIATVDQKAIEIAARRADLEREAALAYARVFSEEDLRTIATFYDSAAGKKLIEDGPIVAREIYQAADIWQRGISRDLAQEVAENLAEKFPQANTETSGGATPAPGQPATPQ